MSNLSDIDVSDAKELGDFSPFPPGEYVLYIEESERKSTNAGDGEYLSCVIKVKEGEYEGRKIFHRFNLWNKNQVAVDIAKSEFKALCEACVGLPNAPNGKSESLHFKPFIGPVEIEVNKQDGKSYNRLKFSKGTIRAVSTASQPAMHQEYKASAQTPPWKR